MLCYFLLPLLLSSLAIPAIAQTVDVRIAESANVSSGQKVQVGQRIVTGAAGIVTGSFSWGGVKAIRIMPRSSLMLRTYGFTANNGRSSEFFATGTVYLTVRTTNKFSKVKACFANFWGKTGCSLIRSDIRLFEVAQGETGIAVREGNVIVQDEQELTKPVFLAAGDYSLLTKSGAFTEPISVFNVIGFYLSYQRSKTIGVYRAYPGWTFDNGKMEAQGAIGTPWRMKSPLDDD